MRIPDWKYQAPRGGQQSIPALVTQRTAVEPGVDSLVPQLLESARRLAGSLALLLECGAAVELQVASIELVADRC